MHLKFLLISALSAFAAAQAAVNPLVPLAAGIQSGVPTTIAWSPTTQGTVSLQLRWGDPNDLKSGSTIAANIPNSGSYTWTPDPQLKAGSDYTIHILNDANPADTNYSPAFAIASNGQGLPEPPSASTTTVIEVESASTVAVSGTGSSVVSLAVTKTSTRGVEPTENAAAAGRVDGKWVLQNAVVGVGALLVGAM